MAKNLSHHSINMLENVKQQGKINIYSFIKQYYKNESYRKIYTQIYQLQKRGYLDKYKHKDIEYLKLSDKGDMAVSALKKEKDGKWRIIIFDIPENKRQIRDYLRTKLKQLGFKKWQNSIWITPYKLSEDVLRELDILSTKYLVRLITIAEINNDSDLRTLFGAHPN